MARARLEIGWLVATVIVAGLIVGMTSPLRAQVVLHPNQIGGDISFTNMNPEILAVLQRPLTRASVGAAHDPLFLRSYGSGVGTTLAATSYEITVDTTEDGLEYDVQASLVADRLKYGTSVRRSGLVMPEPTPDIRLDIPGCAALVRVQFADPAGTPVEVLNVSLVILGDRGWRVLANEASMRGSAESPVTSSLDALAEADGLEHDVEIAFDMGSDPFHDTIRWVVETRARLDCDAIAVIPIEVVPGQSPGSGLPLPRIIGMVDILGRDEVRAPTSLTGISSWGPWDNSRRDFIDRTPSSGPFELENLVPSSVTAPPERWGVSAATCFGLDHDASSFNQSASCLVPDTGTLDFGETFVVDPGTVLADVRVAGPPDSGDPVLADVRIIDDMNGDGIADGPCAPWTRVSGSASSSSLPPGVSSWGATSMAGIGLAYDPAGHHLLGVSSVTVGGPARTVVPWSVRSLTLDYEDTATPGNPVSWRDGSVSLSFSSLPDLTVRPGETQATLLHACMSEVYLAILSDGVPFEQPRLILDGGRFEGVDFEGRSTSYTASGSAAGMPLDPASASTEGLVVAMLPEGDWNLSVTVTAHDPGGTTSRTELVNFPLHVGCGQIINLTSQIQLNVQKLAPCTGPGLITVRGSVASVRPVARIAWSLDGGPWTDACTNCGVNPIYSFDVIVPSADSRLIVKAWDETGLQASVTAFTGLTGEPSAVDIRPMAPPLRVAKSGSGLRLDWEARPVDVYTVHEGTIAALNVDSRYDHGAVIATCRQNGNAASLAMPAADAYFLVTEACEFGNGSFGRDSFGRERPPTSTGCP